MHKRMQVNWVIYTFEMRISSYKTSSSIDSEITIQIYLLYVYLKLEKIHHLACVQ